MAKDIFANKKIAVIGGGHMGTALVQGLVNVPGVSRSRIVVSDNSKSARLKQLSVRTTTDNAAAARYADWIFIAVKPSVVENVLDEIKPFARGKLIISLAAGVRVADIRKRLRGASITRIMPNIPVRYNQGVIGLFAPKVSASEKKDLRTVVSRLGLLVDVKKESELDLITLIAGCGPGIVAALVEMVAKRARTLGLREADAIALQTFMGAIHYMIGSGTSASDLMKSVATKGGVTEAIIKSLGEGTFEKNFARAIEAGEKKLKSIKG